MLINADTKIAAILKENTDALEAIISISAKFKKLRNPLLRKLMAGRTSIAMAAKIAACNANDFFVKLKPLGFEMDKNISLSVEEKKPLPAFLNNIQKAQITALDVRPVIASGKDPLPVIIEKIKSIQPGQILKIINSFEPTPLMLLLKKKGFESFADTISDTLVETYFYKKTAITTAAIQQPAEATDGWDAILQRFKDGLQTIDVRQMDMPLPMITILDALDKLPAETALFVYHKRIPVFLLPELVDRNFSYRIKEISDGEVHLIIFKA